MHRLIVGLVVLAFAGCGDDGKDAGYFVGVYEVTYHTRNEVACDVEGAPSTDYDYFQLTEDEFFGRTFLAFAECGTSDPTSCSGGGIFNSYFKLSGDWVNELMTSSGGGDIACVLGFVHGEMVEQDDGSLRFEIFSYVEEDDTLSEEECDTDLAQARGDSMPCESYEVIVGAPLAAAP
jgi:hypothetical protein